MDNDGCRNGRDLQNECDMLPQRLAPCRVCTKVGPVDTKVDMQHMADEGCFVGRSWWLIDLGFRSGVFSRVGHVRLKG